MQIFQLQIQDMEDVFTKWGEGVLCPREWGGLFQGRERLLVAA